MKTQLNIRAFLASIGLFACLLPFGLRAAGPPIPTVANDPITAWEYQVVGVTSTTTTGRVTAESADGALVGYGAMNKLCQDEVDSNSRVATAAEWGSGQGSLPAAPAGAWLDPASLNLLYDPVAPDPASPWCLLVPHDINTCTTHYPSPSEASSEADCDKHFLSSDGHFGYAGGRGGSVSKVRCTEELPVACSALVAVPIRH